jgi:hypothetical protein
MFLKYLQITNCNAPKPLELGRDFHYIVENGLIECEEGAKCYQVVASFCFGKDTNHRIDCTNLEFAEIGKKTFAGLSKSKKTRNTNFVSSGKLIAFQK